MNSVYIQIIINILLTIISNLLLFFINKYFLQVFNIELLGLMKLFTQILAYLKILESGLVTASNFAFYRVLAQKDNVKLNILFSSIRFIYRNIFILILTLGTLMAPFLSFFIKENIPNHNIYIYWILYIIGATIPYLYSHFTILMAADQRIIIVKYVHFIISILTFFLQIFIIFKTKSFFAFIFIIIITEILKYYIFKYINSKYYSYIKIVKERDYSILQKLKKLVFHKLSDLIIQNTDLVLISRFISLNVVGIYASYLMINNIIITFLETITYILRPRIGKNISKNDNLYNYQKYQELNIFFLYIGTCLTLSSFYLINDFVKLWIGDLYLLDKIVIILMHINIMIYISKMILEIFKEGYGFFDDIHLSFLEALIKLSFSLVLIKYVGLKGVVIGTLISNILIVCTARPITIYSICFKKNIFDYLKNYLQYLLIIIISVLINHNTLTKFIISKSIINSWYEWFLNAVIITIIVAVNTTLIFLINYQFRKKITEVKTKIKF
ncbi:MAG: lipopolysaccharide biosynthesis protein [Fusobacterium sp.]|uniref:lipopolysaccharide biosynthesis protein n=1 Tax=Fusobacterium sp. TaxID=68766 RepID=UPI003F9FC787